VQCVRELFRRRRPGCGDCLLEVGKLRPARVYAGLATSAAKRVIIVPFQKGELLSAVRAEVGYIAANFIALDNKPCLLF
jgi:hypothetical protein